MRTSHPRLYIKNGNGHPRPCTKNGTFSRECIINTGPSLPRLYNKHGKPVIPRLYFKNGTPAIKLDLAFYFVECNSEISDNSAMENQTASRKFVLVCETRVLNLIIIYQRTIIPITNVRSL